MARNTRLKIGLKNDAVQCDDFVIEDSQMKNLKKPVGDWAMVGHDLEGMRYVKESDGFDDVCRTCAVDGGCDDRNVRCALVAVHGLKADSTSARRLRNSDKYLEALARYVEEHGDTPYPEQRDLIATTRAMSS